MKKNVLVMMFGILSILLPLAAISITLMGWSFFSSQIGARNLMGNFLFFFIIFYYIVTALIAIVGLIMGMKSPRPLGDKSIIIYTTFCLIGLIITVVLGWYNIGIILSSV